MSDESKDVLRGVPMLEGSGNYAAWSRKFLDYLKSVDLDNFLHKDASSFTDADNIKLSKKCAALLKRSVSDQVYASIPESALRRSPNRPDLIWAHLKETYSSGTSLRKFELAQTLFRFNIPDDEDPSPHIATMTSAHQQLVDGGEKMSDSLFALALAMSLPASFDQQKQALWMQGDKLTSAMVATAARGEWSRRTNKATATAAKASVKPAKSAKSTSAQANSASQRSGGGKRDKARNNKGGTLYCKYHDSSTHNTAECSMHKRMQELGIGVDSGGTKGKAKANKAEAKAANDDASDLEYYVLGEHSSLLAHCLTATASNALNVLIDSGASRDMFHNKDMFLSLQELPNPVKIEFGNKQHLTAHKGGEVKVGDIICQNVLYVPGLSHNLLSVSATPNRFYWTIKSNKAILRDAGEPRIVRLYAPAVSGLYVYNSANGKRISTEVLNSANAALKNCGGDHSANIASSDKFQSASIDARYKLSDGTGHAPLAAGVGEEISESKLVLHKNAQLADSDIRKLICAPHTQYCR